MPLSTKRVLSSSCAHAARATTAATAAASLTRRSTRRRGAQVLDLRSRGLRIRGVGSRHAWATLVLATLLAAGCGRAEEPSSADGDLGFVPATYRDGERVVLPLTFPDGTSAELVYPPELAIAELGVYPYSSGRLGDVGRDFLIRSGELAQVLSELDGEGLPDRLAQYEGADGQAVGFWDLQADETAHYLGFQFGRWSVLVYDYAGGEAAMTDAERASWAASFSGRETDDGFLVLEGSGPLRLARAGEHARPELDFSEFDPERGLGLYPGECAPHADQNRLVNGRAVEWQGGFADWCLSDSMRIHASGSREFVGALIRGLEVRHVDLAG